MTARTTAARALRLLPLAGALAAPGCYSWHTDTRPVTQVIAAGQPKELRVRRSDGSTVVLKGPRLVSDTSKVLGTGSDSAGASDTLVAGELVARTLAGGEVARGGGRRNATVLVRASDVKQVETRVFSRSRTWGAVGLGVAFAAFVAATFVH